MKASVKKNTAVTAPATAAPAAKVTIPATAKSTKPTKVVVPDVEIDNDIIDLDAPDPTLAAAAPPVKKSHHKKPVTVTPAVAPAAEKVAVSTAKKTPAAKVEPVVSTPAKAGGSVGAFVKLVLAIDNAKDAKKFLADYTAKSGSVVAEANIKAVCNKLDAARGDAMLKLFGLSNTRAAKVVAPPTTPTPKPAATASTPKPAATAADKKELARFKKNEALVLGAMKKIKTVTGAAKFMELAAIPEADLRAVLTEMPNKVEAKRLRPLFAAAIKQLKEKAKKEQRAASIIKPAAATATKPAASTTKPAASSSTKPGTTHKRVNRTVKFRHLDSDIDILVSELTKVGAKMNTKTFVTRAAIVGKEALLHVVALAVSAIQNSGRTNAKVITEALMQFQPLPRKQRTTKLSSSKPAAAPVAEKKVARQPAKVVDMAEHRSAKRKVA
jgi:hypothetical protein